MVDYTSIHFFDKSGAEIPISHESHTGLIIPNAYGNDAIFHILCNVNGNISGAIAESKGARFKKSDFISLNTSLNGVIVGNLVSGTETRDVSVQVHAGILHSSEGSEYYIDSLNDPYTDLSQYSDNTFPGVLLDGKLEFSKVSTGLVETQTIYMLAETTDSSGRTVMEKISNLPEWAGWCDRFKIILYIDCRNQNDFRLFRDDGDEIVWSNKLLVDLSSDYRAEIGFTGENEGVYTEKMHICLVDTYDKDTSTSIGAIYPIGSFSMSAETVGEDERYRTLFTNFGIPDPINYLDVYKDTDSNESKKDMQSLNRHSKEIFLTYHEIFPYVGTYKALINATKVLGYDDIFFKEWYKELGENRYLAVDMRIGDNSGDTIIDAMTIEERIHLKKLNWISMMYRLNEEDTSKPRDRYGFPTMKNVYTYSNAAYLLKLISLRKWLEKYVTGLHCRIIDIGGEGMYFEKYINGAFGGVQANISFDHVINMTPVADKAPAVLIDSSAYISADISDWGSTTIGDLKGFRLKDFARGYLDISTGLYHECSDITDASTRIYIGSTLENISGVNMVEADAKCDCDRFIFKHSISDSQTHGLILEDNDLKFLATDMENNDMNTVFSKLPVIRIKNGRFMSEDSNGLKTEYSIDASYNNGICTCKISKVGSTEYAVYNDYVSLIPPSYTLNTSDVSITPIDGSTFAMPISESFVGLPKGQSGTSYDYKYDFSDTLSEPCGNKSVYKKDIRTYGLRYTLMKDGTPVFKIVGYQTHEHDGFRINPVEYILDIMDGYMVFSDDDNDRLVYLNFNYDDNTGDTTPSISCKYHMKRKYMVTYHDASTSLPDFHEFADGNSYPGFVYTYMNDSSSAISYDNHISMIVRGTGDYDIAVRLFDREGVAFTKKAIGKAYVIMQEPTVSTYVNKAFSGNEFAKAGTPITVSEKSTLMTEYEDHCIMDYAQTYTGITPPSLFADPYKIMTDCSLKTYDKKLPAVSDYVHFTTTADEFDLVAIDRINECLHTGNGEGLGAKEYYIILKRNGRPSQVSRFAENSNDYDALRIAYNRGDTSTPLPTGITISDVISANTDYEDNPLRVNLIFYDKVGGFPLVQVPAFMANASALNMTYNSDEYHAYIPNPDAGYFIWATAPQGTSPSSLGNLVSMTKNGTTYYAVTAKDGDGNRYYIRNLDATAGAFEVSDIPYVGETLVDDLMIDDIILGASMNKGIGVYAQPAWRSGCSIDSIDEVKNTMTVKYNALPYGNMFHAGQMVKLILDSPFNEAYTGQASYKVVSINESARTVVLENIANRNYVDISDNLYITASLNPYDLQGQRYDVDANGYLIYIDPITGVKSKVFNINGISYSIEAKYNSDRSMILYGIYVYHAMISKVYMIGIGGQERKLASKCYLAYSHEAFADYDFKITDFVSSENSITVEMEYSVLDKKVSRFVDKTFGMTYREFDTDNIGKYWMGCDVSNDVVIPDLFDDQVYKYDCPVTFTSGTKRIALCADPSSSYITGGNYYVKWKVYRRNDAHNEQELLLVSNNRVLYLDVADSDTYDAELTIMDKYGSSVTHMIRGFCKSEE